MKHLLALLTVALAGAATTAFAADPLFADPVFNGVSFNETTPYTNQNNQGAGNGSYYTIRFNGSGTFYLTNRVISLYWGGQNLTQSEYGIANYGYIDSNGVEHPFDISDPNNIVQFTSQSDVINGQTYTVTREGYRLGNFNAGDEVQIFFSGTYNGNDAWTATNTPQEGVYSSRFGGIDDGFNSAMTLGQLYFADQNSVPMYFGVVASAQNYTPGDGGGTFGSPLPGGLQIAIIAGVFGLGLYYFRRRKAVAV